MRQLITATLILMIGGALAEAAPAMDEAGSGIGLHGGQPAAGPFSLDGPVVRPDAPSIEHAPPDAPPPVPTAAARRKARLDGLFDRLAKAQDATEASAVTTLIMQVLMNSGSDTADLLMQRVVAAMETKDNATAAALLDKLVLLRPTWAEAWNKRATVRYLEDDDVGSMADIGRVLALEPRHFGALGGMGLILHRNGQDRSALQVFRRAAAVNPQDPGVKLMIEQIAPAVEGSDL